MWDVTGKRDNILHKFNILREFWRAGRMPPKQWVQRLKIFTFSYTVDYAKEKKVL